VNKVEKMANMQSLTISVRSCLADQALRLSCARDTGRIEAGLEIVAGYLARASDDVRRLGEAMLGQVTELELEFLTAIAQVSVRRYHRALEQWKRVCH